MKVKKMKNKELIIIKQLPIIEEKLKELSKEIDEKVEKAKSLIVSEETVKEVKKTRAELTKDFKELEEQRKLVKEKVLAPYMAFEEVYKTYVSDKYKSADIELKTKIDQVELEQKKAKEQEVRDYFEEYKTSKNIDFITFENMNLNITLSASLKSLKEEAKAFVDKVESDLNLIETQEAKIEILVEYKKDLNVSRAITEVNERIKRLEEEKKKQEELQKIKVEETKVIEKVEEVIKAPIEEVKEEIFEMTFKVKATMNKLKLLKIFLNQGGYDYE